MRRASALARTGGTAVVRGCPHITGTPQHAWGMGTGSGWWGTARGELSGSDSAPVPSFGQVDGGQGPARTHVQQHPGTGLWLGWGWEAMLSPG